MKAKTYTEFYKGIAMSDFIGQFSDMQNCDVYGKIGVLQAQLSLAKESGSTIDEPCYQATDKSGNTYFFSAVSGKRWKRTSGGSYSALSTNSNGSHKGAEYYDGYIYFATNTKLGRMQVSSGTFTDSWQTLSSGEHPMHRFDMMLYIGNGNNVASVSDAGTFSSSGLDLPEEYSVKALTNIAGDLIVLAGSQVDSKGFRWNTYSSSWTVSDPIKELDVLTFLDADNLLFAISKAGSIYYYNGRHFTKKRIMPEFASLNHAMTTNFKGRPLIAQGKKIYSYDTLPGTGQYYLVGEYTATDTITSIEAVGEKLLVSHNSGVDNLTNYRADAYVDTPITLGRYSDVIVGYQDIPANTSIDIDVLIDDIDKNNIDTSPTVVKDETDERIVRLDKKILNKRNVMARVHLNSNTTHTPIIDSITLK